MRSAPDLKSLKIGKDGIVRYNAITKKVQPSDRCFKIVTLTIILGPTAAGVMVTIYHNELMFWWLKLILTILDLTSLYFSLKNLYLCSTTDPGIIPSISQHSGISELDLPKPDPQQDYYVLY